MEWVIGMAAGLLIAGVAWFSHRFAWWRPVVPAGDPRILMYHMVRDGIPGSRSNKLRVPPDLFEKQVRWLKAEGYAFVTVSQLLDEPAGGAKRVAITFDDGYRDNLANALPILRKYGACMTLYLVGDRERCPDWPAQRKSGRAGTDLSREERLSDDEVREMLASGVVELGSHTMTHVDLTREDIERDHELLGSKAHIEELFDVPVRTFCYPFGLFSAGDPDRLRECGYEAALTTEQGISDIQRDDPMRWKRVKVSGTEGMFAFRLRMRTGRRGL